MSPSVTRCLASRDVSRFVEHFAQKLSWRLPRTFDLEDSRQELWLAVIKKVQDEEDSPEVIRKATAAAMSRYGNLIRGRFRTEQEMINGHAEFADIPSHDHSFNLVETKDILDRLQAKMSGNKQLTRVYELYRFGKNSEEIALELGLSSSRIRRIKQEIVTVAATL